MSGESKDPSGQASVLMIEAEPIDTLPQSQSSKKHADTADINASKRECILTQHELEKEKAPMPSIITLFRRSQKYKLDQIATQPSVYDDPATAKYFQPTEKYENLHRFDPSARWTWAEELPLVNKIDRRITLWACIAFFALDLDRGNIGQANTDNFLSDMNMTTNDYNLGSITFRLTFLCAELPSQLISKKLGPDRWIPAIMVMWSLVAASQFWLNGRTSFLVCRALLGMFQGGFIPDVILYMTYFFKGTELPFRLAVFYSVMRVVDCISPIMAYALYRPNGWFTEREEVILVNRVLRDDLSKGDMHNRQAVDWKLLWQSLKDFDLWPIYITGIIWSIPCGPIDQYMTLTLRSLGFSTFDSNLLTIPSQVVGAITLLTFTYLSELFNQRALMGMFVQVWLLPNIIALATIPSSTSAWAKFAILTTLLSFPSPHAMQVEWVSRNSNAVRARTVSAALDNIFVQIGRIIYANVYREDDKPEYRRGNRQIAIVCGANIVIHILVKLYYIWRNRQRGAEWSRMTKEEQFNYLETTTDTGSKRKDFQFVH